MINVQLSPYDIITILDALKDSCPDMSSTLRRTLVQQLVLSYTDLSLKEKQNLFEKWEIEQSNILKTIE